MTDRSPDVTNAGARSASPSRDTRGRLRRRPLVLLLAAVALVSLPFVLRPEARLVLPSQGPGRPPVRGALHVHTRLSDGSGTAAQVAAAAAGAGLQFVILTDHGDGLRRPEPPQ